MTIEEMNIVAELDLSAIFINKQKLERLSKIYQEIDIEDDEGRDNAARDLIYSARKVAVELENANPYFTFANMGIDCEGGISAFAIQFGNRDVSCSQNCEDGIGTSLGVDIDGYYIKEEVLNEIKTYYSLD